MRRLAALAAVWAAVALAGAAGASAAPSLHVGIYDEAQTLFPPNAEDGFKTLVDLEADVLRLNLYWNLVAVARPGFPRIPHDPAYNWSLYDRALRYAQQYGIRIVLSIWGTPDWANGGKGPNFAPRKIRDLENFAAAAATRYSGKYAAPDPGSRSLAVHEGILPKVDLWLAWNEPNSPPFLKPQGKKVKGRWVAASPAIYAKICNAVHKGVHAAGKALEVAETVGCGVTNPRGNNIFSGKRASVSPLAFLRGMKAAGAKFDVYAHNPYPITRFDTPTSKPKARTAVTLGNIATLIKELDRLYPRKLPLWITEYGYQTNPPDQLFGVSPETQAAYLAEAFQIARAHPRIGMMLWFLIKDEEDVGRWQSGLVDASGEKKPAYAAFKALPG